MIKEISFNEIMNSEAYSMQKTIINNEINCGDPKKEYFPDRKVFEKLTLEPEMLKDAKKKWRKQMKERWGDTWTKRSASRKYGEFHNRMN